MLVSLKSEFKIFYLDDGTIGGPLEEVVADFKQIEQVSDDLGLAINHSKSEVICVDDITSQDIQSISPMFQITDPADACLLGSPIGGPQSINQVLSTKKASLERLGERLRLLHSHDGLCLLKNALALPKVLYVLRTAPCFDSPILPELDSLQKSLLEDICTVHLSDEAWAQASLPVQAGCMWDMSISTLTLIPSSYLPCDRKQMCNDRNFGFLSALNTDTLEILTE